MSSALLARWSLIVAPPAFIVVWIVGTGFAGSIWIPLGPTIAIYAALVYFAFVERSGSRRRHQTGQWFARASALSGVLLIPAVLFATAADWTRAEQVGPARIDLEFNPNPGDRARVTGLNVRWAPTIRKIAKPGGTVFSLEMSQAAGRESRNIPAKLEDGFGNSVSATEPNPGRLRLTDGVGGTVDIDWTAAAPRIVASQAVPRTASTIGPSRFGRRSVAAGQYALLIVPLVGMLLFAFARRHATNDTGSLLTNSIWIQSLGLALHIVVLGVVWLASGQSGERGISAAAMSICTMTPAILTSLVGISLHSLHFARAP